MASAVFSGFLRQQVWLLGSPVLGVVMALVARGRRLPLLWGLVAADYAYRLIAPKTVIGTTGPIYLHELVPLFCLLTAAGGAPCVLDGGPEGAAYLVVPLVLLARGLDMRAGALSAGAASQPVSEEVDGVDVNPGDREGRPVLHGLASVRSVRRCSRFFRTSSTGWFATYQSMVAAGPSSKEIFGVHPRASAAAALSETRL